MLGVLGRIRDLTSLLSRTQLWRMSDADSRAAVAEGFAAIGRLQAGWLGLVADLDGRAEAVPRARPGTVARTFLRHAVHRTAGQAAADVRAAHALRPDADPASGGLPRLGAALAAGEVSREHVDAVVGAVGQIPRHLLAEPAADDVPDSGGARCGGDVVDEVLTDRSKEYDSSTTRWLTGHLLDVLDPDGSRSFDPDAVTRRGLRLVQDRTGMFQLRGDLDQPGGALVKAVLDHLAAPGRGRTEQADDGALIEVTDSRTARQRMADALVEMARLASSGGQSGGGIGTRGGEPPRITIQTTVEDLATARAAAQAAQTTQHPGQAFHPGQPCSEAAGGDLGAGMAVFGTGERVDPGLLALFSCDAVLQSVLLARNGAVLDLGREVRTASPAQRRALAARDGGCVIPACTAPASWCHGHHVRYWRHNGPTDIGNLALLCSAHHTQVHAGLWVVVMRDGVPWVRPPAWLDGAQRLIRNTYFDHVRQVRQTGVQLRLNLGQSSAGWARLLPKAHPTRMITGRPRRNPRPERLVGSVRSKIT